MPRKIDIDITPAMIEAGASVLRWSGPVDWNSVDWVVQELAADTFRAMLAASDAKAPDWPRLQNQVLDTSSRIRPPVTRSAVK